MASAPQRYVPLAFGKASSVICQSRSEAAQKASQLIPGLVDLEFLRGKDCHFETAATSVNGLRLAAFSATASRLTLRAQSEAVMILPLSGSLLMTADGKSIQSHASSSGLLIRGGLSNQIDAGDRSLVRVRIDSDRLQKTVLAMLGGQLGNVDLSILNRPREVLLTHGVVSFHAAFRCLFNLIDSYQGNQSLLDASGIDDILYRRIGMALLPDTFAALNEDCAIDHGTSLKLVCDYVMENLSGRITLTDLERVGHMSRRTLHNSFRKVFGVSPIEWVRGQRLVMAQSLLANTRGLESVTEVLYACGFTNASLFSAQYRHRFGEMPSETLRAARKLSKCVTAAN